MRASDISEDDSPKVLITLIDEAYRVGHSNVHRKRAHPGALFLFKRRTSLERGISVRHVDDDVFGLCVLGIPDPGDKFLDVIVLRVVAL